MSSGPDLPLAEPEPWNDVSAGYDAYTRKFLGKFSEAARVDLDLAASHHLLDVACGPGTTTLLYAPHVARIEAVDFAEQMLAIAKKHIKDRKLQHVRAQQANGQALPFEGAAFDRAVSMFGLMFFPDRVAGLKEIFRCLKPGGKVLIGSWAPLDQSPLFELLVDAARSGTSEKGPGANTDGAPAAGSEIENWEDPNVIRGEFEAAGFVDIQTREQSCSYEFASGQALWDELVEGAVPLTRMKKFMDDAAWNRFSQGCRKHWATKLQGQNALSTTALLTYANKPA